MIQLAGCVIMKKDSILLLLHRKKTDWYELPGGKVEKSEEPEETAKREISEELCCKVQIKGELGSREFEENGHVMKYHWFRSSVENENTIELGEPEKFSHFRYIPIEDLDDYVLSPNMQNLLQEIKGKSIVLN